MRKIIAAAGTILAFGIAGVAFAQTALPEGVTDEQMSSALKDLSAVYGASVVRIDQAKAICNEEKYVVNCAEIGKKHDLFSDDRAKQVDTLLTEFKGEIVEKMKQCDSAACLVDVAASIAGRLNSGNPSVARAVELTPQKVNEKRVIVDTAKSLGVDIEACRTMDPDTASIELLRGCARLAKHENVQKYVPQTTKDRAKGADAAIALKESLASGQTSCGDNTLEGCGNFCLAPSADARANGSSAIPEVCRQIAAKFFGDGGVKELENAYSTVQKTFDTFADRAQNVAFTTADGKTLSDPGSIGRYMEEAGSRGDVEAVSKGMDFLIAKGFVTAQDRDFALSMVKKVKESGPVDFGACRADPSKCANLISEEERGQFTTMGEIEKIMRSEMSKRGVADPSLCSSDPSAGQSCLLAARAALPQIELLAENSPQAQAIVADIRQKIRFGEAGLEARTRVEERFKAEGDFSIGDSRFGSFNELDAFCRTNSQQCLNETAREGIFSKDVAAERYERTIEIRYDKEEALRQFKQWLDNPQGPPPMPPGQNTSQYPQYSPYPQYPQQYPNQYPDYQRPSTDLRNCQYATVMPTPCKSGEYRQESRNEFGCSVFGSCIPFNTKTEPPRTDELNICPALPTVESCPAGEEKAIAFSSPECGTYYSCQSVYKPPVPDDQNRTASSCERYGSGWHTMDSSGNCFSPLMTEYRTVDGALNSCATAPVYGCGSSDVSPSPVSPSEQREQVWNSLGLRSWVRTDADQSRIESLKQACASVSSRANVWLSGAGTQSSPDFGMPDSGKCARAAACTGEQYFDGASCVTGTQSQSQSCGYNEYWNGSACVSSTTQTNTNTTATGSCSSELIGLLGSGCHSMGSGWFNESMTQYALSGSQTVRSCATEPVSGCSGGTNVQTQTSSCTSGQYWDGSACQTTSVYDTPSSYDSTSAQQGCTNVGGTWNSASNYCNMPTTCPSGQYWNGSACQSSESTYTAPTYTPPPDSTYTAPSGDTYVAPSSDTYVPPPTTESEPPPTTSEPTAYLFCPDGHDWNGAYCTLSPLSPFERYTANAWSAFRSLIGI